VHSTRKPPFASVSEMHCHVWTAPAVKGFFDVLHGIGGAVMSSAFVRGSESFRWP
jgi:hypothetical protein